MEHVLEEGAWAGQQVAFPDKSISKPSMRVGNSRSGSLVTRSSAGTRRRLSVYDQDAEEPTMPLPSQGSESEWQRIEFPEGEPCVVEPYRSNCLAKLLITASCILGPLYCFYLWCHPRPDMPVFSIIFLLGEIGNFFVALANRLVLWHRQRRYVCRLDSLTPNFPLACWPKVQIFFTHYMEPVSESVKPLKRSLKQQYPPELFVVTILDDGYHKRLEGKHETTELGREMEDMISSTMALMGPGGCGKVSKSRRVVLPGAREGYRPEAAPGGSTVVEFRMAGLPLVRLVGRMKGPNSFLKTGNLENALWNVMEPDVPFMVVLDTDMAPEKDMLQLLLSPMLECHEGQWRPNWRTAFVSSPQHSSNIERVFGTDDPMNQANKNYWRIMSAALDSWGLAHFWGTNAAFFVPALRDVLGFAYGRISEDTATGLALHRFGWESLFVGPASLTLASGLCRESVSETFDQRKRWAQGNFQLMLAALDPPFLLHASFRNPPYLGDLRLRARQLRASDRSGAAPEPLAPADTGAAVRRSRRTRLWAVKRFVAYLSTCQMVIFNVMPWYYYTIALAIVFTGNPPMTVDMRRVRSFWDAINTFYIIVAYWLVTGVANVVLNSYILTDPNNPSNTLWRTQQEFWGYSWIRVLGMLEGSVSAVTGKQPKWNSFGMAKNVNLVYELPNALAFVAMAVSMALVTANFGLQSVYGIGLRSLPGPETSSWLTVVASSMAGFWVLFLLWPVTSCIFADFLRVPYYSVGGLFTTLVAGMIQVGIAACWTLSATETAA